MYRRGGNSVRRMYPGCISIVRERLQQSRTYAEKDPKGSGKDDIPDIRISGYVNPDTLTEKSYYSEKSRKQLEELKKRLQKTASEKLDDKKQ